MITSKEGQGEMLEKKKGKRENKQERAKGERYSMGVFQGLKVVS